MRLRPERWRKLTELYDMVLAEEANQLAAFLDKACAVEADLRREN